MKKNVFPYSSRKVPDQPEGDSEDCCFSHGKHVLLASTYCFITRFVLLLDDLYGFIFCYTLGLREK